MHKSVVIVYNQPHQSRYNLVREEKAVLGVLDSVNAVAKALCELGYKVSLLPLAPPFAKARKKLAALDGDVVFNLFEGFCGEPQTEMLVPEALNELGIKYTGCRPQILRLALDKARVKSILKDADIPTPDFQVLNPYNLYNFGLVFPCIVKPRAEDASHGITTDSLVTDYYSLQRQVRVISNSYQSGALVEHFIGGREFNATVIGNSHCVVLPVSEIVYTLSPGTPRILTFEAKWGPDSPYYKGTEAVCPAKVSERQLKHIADTALSVFKLLVGHGYARVDMRLDEAGKLNIIEINPNPDISPDAGAARQSLSAGMSYTEFIDTLVNTALE